MDKKIWFKKAKWIWENVNAKSDEYALFKFDINCNKELSQILSISADSNYALYINDALATFGQYPDYPHYKVGDVVDISNFVNPGLNNITIIVWYYGKSNMSYAKGNAGLIFEICEGDNILAYSSKETLSCLSNKYINHKCKDITSQLGLTFEYDATKQDGKYSYSTQVDNITYDINERPIKKLIIKDDIKFKKVFGGTYIFCKERESLASDMQRAYLSFIRPEKIEEANVPFILQSNDENNVYCVIDLLEETCGFLSFDIDFDEECDIYIAYGEHLSDGRVRTHKRNFTCIYHAKKGKNIYLNPFRRFGCRYLQLFFTTKNVKVNYIGIREIEYPLNMKEPKFDNVLRNTIYKVSQRTLSLCMHDHYEDCPWREQGLYALDSRNQMLFGYYAFNEYAFPRASLYLMSKGLRKKDNLLSICFPSDDPLTIPSFSLMYFVEMWEYIKYSGDTTLAEETYDILQKLMNTYIQRIDSNGLCKNFTGEDNDYWGFYEWSETLTGNIKGEKENRYECPLNAYLSLALLNLSNICISLGKIKDGEYYKELSKKINEAIIKHFWNEDDKLFISFLPNDDKKYSVLVNAMCVLCGACDKIDKTNIEKILITNGDGEDNIVPITLSMHVFRYDALLKIDKSLANFVLNDIDNTFLYMLRKGATSFWETIKGEDDFAWVGSLCHGWSALPIYYYDTLIK